MIFNPTVQGGKQEAPVISVSSSGLITATAGDQSTTQQLPTQAARTITPSTSTQTAVASGRYTTGNVTVAGSANLVPENIKSGVNIFGVTGTFEGGSELVSVKISTGRYSAEIYYSDGETAKKVTVPIVGSAQIYAVKNTLISASWKGSSISVQSGSAQVFEDYYVFVSGNCELRYT